MQVRTKLSHLAKLSKLDFVDVPSALPLLELDQPGLVEETEGPTLPDELQAEPTACLMIFPGLRKPPENIENRNNNKNENEKS